eukprot:766642-Hanusia_phi.AAC.3
MVEPTKRAIYVSGGGWCLSWLFVKSARFRVLSSIMEPDRRRERFQGREGKQGNGGEGTRRFSASSPSSRKFQQEKSRSTTSRRRQMLAPSW